MIKLKKFKTDKIPAEEAAAVAGAIALYLDNTKFVIKSIKPLEKGIALFEKSQIKTTAPDAKYSFFTWRPKS